MFDVGIAEQHAVTFAAGLATEGYKPFCAIYSTFLQRGYDQLVHDVAMQNLPVRFAIDRAGLVGADGATHAGAFDIAYLTCLPNMTVMAAPTRRNSSIWSRPPPPMIAARSRLRYPRGEGVGVDMPEQGEILPIGKGRIVREGSRIAILSLGTRLRRSVEGGGGTRGAGPIDHGRRRALRQAPRSRTHSQARGDAQAPDHDRGRRGRAVSARMC